MLRNSKLLVGTIIIAALLFGGIIFIEKKIVNYTPTSKVVYCKKNIEKNQPLKESDFVITEEPITKITTDTVTSLDSIKGKYAKENIYASEPLNKKRVCTLKDIENYSLSEDQRLLSLRFTDISDAVGGTLRENDIVDIICTTTSSITGLVETKVITKNVTVLGAGNGNGVPVEKKDKSTAALDILIGMKSDDAMILENYKKDTNSKITLEKVPLDSTERNNKVVKNGSIIN